MDTIAMSHLLKRTKKTCLKFFRKLSSSKQMYIKQLEEDDLPAQSNQNSSNNNNNGNTHEFSTSCANEIQIVLPKRPRTATGNADEEEAMEATRMNLPARTKRNSAESLPLPTYHCWRRCDDDDDDDDDRRRAATGRGQVLQSLTSKLFLTADGYEFRRLQQLRSDTGSEVLQFEQDIERPPVAVELSSGGGAECDVAEAEEDCLVAVEATGIVDDIVFETVKYKENIRYFRHTPSSSSLDNYAPGGSGLSGPSMANNNSTTNASGAGNRLDGTNRNADNNLRTESGGFFMPLSLESAKLNDNYLHHHHHQDHQHQHHQQPTLQHSFISEMSESAFHSKMAPTVRWDLNGNSLDDNDNRMFINDNWDDFDFDDVAAASATSRGNTTLQEVSGSGRLTYLPDRRCAQLRSDDSQKSSSYRSSSTTLETWLEDDTCLASSGSAAAAAGSSSLSGAGSMRSHSCLTKS